MKRLLALVGLAILVLVLVLPATSFAYIDWGDVGATATKFSVYSYYDIGFIKYSDNYTSAQISTSSSSTPWAATYFTVGQDNVSDTYYIYRGGLEFDTQLLPSNSAITSADLYFYCKSDNSTADFAITVVDGSELLSPPVAANYGSLLASTTSFGTENTSGISTAAYSSIALNAEGLAAVVKGGITKFGLRSSLDISATIPTGQEFIQIWSSESGSIYTPYLSITYTLQAFPFPDKMEISAPRVFTDFKQPGDQLFVFSYKIIYNVGDPTVSSEDCFLIQLLDTDGTTLRSQKGLPAWGYKPASFYFSAASALTLNKAYVIKIVGKTTKFPIVQLSTSVILGVTNDTWKGKCGSPTEPSKPLASWVLNTARDLETYYSATYIVEIGNASVLNTDGASIFLVGIPRLDEVRPDLFSSSEQDRDWGTVDPYDPAFKNKLLNNMGTQLMTAFGNIGSSIGLSGTWVNSMLWGFFTVAVMVTGLSTGLSIAGMVVGIPALMLGLFMGIPPVIGALLGITLMFLLARTLWAARG